MKKKVLLGVCGSIAAYKSPWLVRELRRRDCLVRVVVTPSATHFVAPLALQNLSQHPVIVDPYSDQHQRDGSWHVELANWCDLALVAPCSASTLARLAGGLPDTALALVLLSLPRGCPLYLAPAMDPDLWLHPATQRNLETLGRDGVNLHPPEVGEMASGLVGPGRLPEPAVLADWVCHRPLAGLRVLITAGPTQEALDEVRYLGNHSSGKMGYALAAEAARRGASVTLISGPVSLAVPPGVRRISVTSAQEMLAACQQEAPQAQVIIKAAAVADFAPVQVHSGKLKKEDLGQQWTLQLTRNPDILAWLGEHRQPGQLLVGFALESQDAERHALDKLERKNCDLIILNRSDRPNSGFAGDLNTITLVDRQNLQPLPTMSKEQCARQIWDHLDKGLNQA